MDYAQIAAMQAQEADKKFKEAIMAELKSLHAKVDELTKALAKKAKE